MNTLDALLNFGFRIVYNDTQEYWLIDQESSILICFNIESHNIVVDTITSSTMTIDIITQDCIEAEL